MAHSKFSMDGPVFEISTRQVIPPDNVMLVREEQAVMEASVDTQLFHTSPGSPAPQEEQGEQAEQAADAPENSLLKCIMEYDCDRLHAFQEYERYCFGVNSGSDYDVPEDELTDEMEDTSSDEDQLVPVNLQDEKDPTVQGDHDQPNPVIIPLEDIIAIEGNETSPVNLHVTLVNVLVTKPKDPSTPGHLDFNIATFDSVYDEPDQDVIPENQLDVKVQTVATTSAAEGGSSSLSRILMGIHVGPPESEDRYELPHEAVNADSIDLKDVNETALKRAIEAGAPET